MENFPLIHDDFPPFIHKKNGRYTQLKSLYFQGENVFFEVYMHKSTALIIITIILYISFKINIRFLRESSRGRY